MANGAATSRVRRFPTTGILANENEERIPHWFYRAAVWSGVIMSEPQSPKGWTFNPSTVTLSLVIAGLIAGGSWYLGAQSERERQIMERLTVAERKADAADTKATYAVSGTDAERGHKPEPSPKK